MSKDNKDICSVCGESWNDHDFGVPHPICRMGYPLCKNPKEPLPEKNLDKNMDLLKNFWETQKPDFVNELGIKWFVDVSVTNYCLRENISGVNLDNIMAYVVVFPSGETERVLVDVNKQEVIYSTKSLEEIGVEIDKLKLIKSYKKT